MKDFFSDLEDICYVVFCISFPVESVLLSNKRLCGDVQARMDIMLAGTNLLYILYIFWQ